jgi:hypothetical protein
MCSRITLENFVAQPTYFCTPHSTLASDHPRGRLLIHQTFAFPGERTLASGDYVMLWCGTHHELRELSLHLKSLTPSHARVATVSVQVCVSWSQRGRQSR